MAIFTGGSTMANVFIRASKRCLLVRFGDSWFRYDTWFDLFLDLNPADRLRIQPVTSQEL